MKKVQLASITIPYQTWVPYPAAYLISYVTKDETIRNTYTFRNPLHLPEQFTDDVLKDTDILGLGNYVWNQYVNDMIVEKYKSVRPDGIVIYGGPNVPEQRNSHTERYFTDRPQVDYFVGGVSDEILAEMLRRMLRGEDTFPGVIGHDWDRSDEYLSPKYFAYPYLEGLLDMSMEGRDNLFCVIESDRGCPYRCSFCNWGMANRSKVTKFDFDKVLKSIDRIFNYGKTIRISVANANLGIYKEDPELVKHVWKRRIETGKNVMLTINIAKSANRYTGDVVREIARFPHLGLFPVKLSFQTLTENALKINERNNASFEMISKTYGNLRGNMITELILGLVGETPEGWIETLSKDHELGTRAARVYRMALLNNTPAYEPEFMERHEVKDKLFLVPFDLLRIPQKFTYGKTEPLTDVKSSGKEGYYEFRSASSCSSYSNDDLLEMYFMTQWYQTLNNSKLAYDSMRRSPLTVREQYVTFKDELKRMKWFSRFFDRVEQSFARTYGSDRDEMVIDNMEDAMFLIKSMPFNSIIYHHIDEIVSEMKPIYPDLDTEGLVEENEFTKTFINTIDGEIREWKSNG